jgi:hypothetical protein
VFGIDFMGKVITLLETEGYVGFVLLEQHRNGVCA